jgi:hypothetical protein
MGCMATHNRFDISTFFDQKPDELNGKRRDQNIRCAFGRAVQCDGWVHT